MPQEIFRNLDGRVVAANHSGNLPAVADIVGMRVA